MIFTGHIKGEKSGHIIKQVARAGALTPEATARIIRELRDYLGWEGVRTS